MRRNRLFLLSAGSGAAAALGHAPFGLWPVAMAGFAGLIWLVSRADTARGAAFATWIGGAGYFAVALHWIVEPFLVDVATHGWMAPFALVLMACGLALFWALAGWIAGRLQHRALPLALLLALGELARGYVLTGFPWALPGYIWADTWLLAASAHLGPYGLTATTLVLAAMPAALRVPWRGMALAVLALAGLSLPAFVAGGTGSEALGTVRLVQPNAPQHEKWDPEKAHVFVDRAIAATAAGGGAPDLAIWPESAIPYPLDRAAPVFARIAAAGNGLPTVTGINRRTRSGHWFNSLVLVGTDGALTDVYDKVHLVPFGEYIPLRIGLIRDLAGFSGFGFSAGEAPRLLDTPLGRALPLICYEAIFPRHGSGVDRPDYLLQITNDAWFGRFSGPYQHLDQARFRAVEQGLPLVRAANTGVSAVIGPDGAVLDAIPLGEEGHLDVVVPAGRAQPTAYARTGDWPVLVILLATVAVFVLRGARNPIANRATSS